MKVLTHTVLYTFYLLVVVHLLILIRKSFFVLFHSTPPINNETRGFSVVIAAHNEEQNLQVLLPVLLRQHYHPYEIIVALDRCDDQSLSLLRSIHNERLKVLEITTVPEGFHGKKFAITQAISQASYDWILLTDADGVPVSLHWVKSFNEAITDDTELILGISPYTRGRGALNALIRYETLLTGINYLSAALAGRPYMGVGRNLAYRKDLFLSAGGFADQRGILGGDDDLFVQSHAKSTNTTIVFSAESLTYSAPKRTWKEYLKQKTRHLSVGKHYKAKLKIAHIFDRAIHLLLWLSFLYLVIIYPDRWRIIGVFLLLLVVKPLLFNKIAKKTGLKYSERWFPVVDFLFAVGMPFVGIRAVFVKNIKWS